MKRLAILAPLLVGVVACGSTKAAAPTTTGAPATTGAPTTSAAPTATGAPTTSVAQTTVPAAPDTVEPTTQAPIPGTLASPIPLGTAAEIGRGWTLKIVAYNPNANDLAAKANRDNPKPLAGTVYIMFTIEMTYGGDGEHTQAPPYLLLQSLGPSSKRYDGTSVMRALPPKPRFDNVGEVRKGSGASGNLVQYVDVADAVGLIAFATDILGGRDIYFATS